MQIFFTSTFRRAVKKLHRQQISFLEQAIEAIRENPEIGVAKIGDLAGIRVYKFHIFQQLILLAYNYDELSEKIILVSFSSHENFYDNLKNQIKN